MISDFKSATIKCPIKCFWDVDRFPRIRQYRHFTSTCFHKLSNLVCTSVLPKTIELLVIYSDISVLAETYSELINKQIKILAKKPPPPPPPTPAVFLGKSVLKMCRKFTGEHTCESVISIKLQQLY